MRHSDGYELVIPCVKHPDPGPLEIWGGLWRHRETGHYVMRYVAVQCPVPQEWALKQDLALILAEALHPRIPPKPRTWDLPDLDTIMAEPPE